MTEKHFKFSNEKQRNLNFGKKVDPTEALQRSEGRHKRHLKIDLPMGFLRTQKLPQGINMIRYAVKDIYGTIIPPFTKEYDNYRPVICTFICSEIHPYPLARWTEPELDAWLEKTYGRRIKDWNVTEKEEPGIGQVLFRHEGLMEENLSTGQDNVNKNMFNVREKFVYEHEINWLNERLNIMGFKIKKTDALRTTEKTINRPRKYFYEYGDY